MNTSYFYQFNWDKLDLAYGKATNAAHHLVDLTSTNEDKRDEAIYGFLHSEACHQYTTYSATPLVVRCVIYLLENHDFDTISLKEILGFIGACTYSAKDNSELRKEIILGSKCYKQFIKHIDSSVRAKANELLAYSLSYKINNK